MSKKRKFKQLTVAEGTEIAYRSTRYSRAFSKPLGFAEFRNVGVFRNLRDRENLFRERYNVSRHK